IPTTGGKFFYARKPRDPGGALEGMNTAEKGRFYTLQLTRREPARFFFVFLAFGALSLRIVLFRIPHFLELSCEAAPKLLSASKDSTYKKWARTPKKALGR